jgi:hypothetical protein
MANESKVNEVLGSVLVGAGQINQIAAAAVGLFTLFRQARDAWKAANPDVPDPFLTDADLINALDGSSDALVALADRLLEKYREPVPPVDPVIPV